MNVTEGQVGLPALMHKGISIWKTSTSKELHQRMHHALQVPCIAEACPSHMSCPPLLRCEEALEGLFPDF
jgi:hypothetical protein